MFDTKPGWKKIRPKSSADRKQRSQVEEKEIEHAAWCQKLLVIRNITNVQMTISYDD